jgi:hypothetical protein
MAGPATTFKKFIGAQANFRDVEDYSFRQSDEAPKKTAVNRQS